ncbi:MAG: HU family DNA-binding protein [Calditrichaeota bacterium]|nr:HU family DNA-binding protein [Calditrichota bacterium]
MTRRELIEAIADCSGLSFMEAKRALECFEGIVTNEVKGSRDVRLKMGTFTVARRKARSGRNPRTGEHITIPPTNVLKFKASKSMKSSLSRLRRY